MRIPNYLSPTAMSCWQKEDKTEFFIRYLADNRPPRPPQTIPMAVGSAFDAYVKTHIASILGITSVSFDELFEKQVEEQNRAKAKEDGRVVFEAYKTSGALSDVITLLQQADDVNLELATERTLQCTTCDDPQNSVIIHGRPDLKFKVSGGEVMLDWKVNGFYSLSGVSPARGYVKIRDGWVGKPSKGANMWHKDAYVVNENGLSVNVSESFEDLYPDWAAQLAPYGWICGIPVGQKHPAMIHQIVCRNSQLRVAQHCAYIGADYQKKLFSAYVTLWNICKDPTLYWDSDELARLTRLAENYIRDLGSEEGRIFSEMTREN
jgi:hypothetical protein